MIDLIQPTTIHCWSQPRSVSTSLLYSFSQHDLVGKVVDEPLYGRHLTVNPHLTRLSQERDTVLAEQEWSGDLSKW